MYAGESRVASVVAVDPNAHADQQTRGELFESGPALELVELANGETIWYADLFLNLGSQLLTEF